MEIERYHSRRLVSRREGSGTRGVLDALFVFYETDRIDVSWQIFYFTVFWPCSSLRSVTIDADIRCDAVFEMNSDLLVLFEYAISIC